MPDARIVVLGAGEERQDALPLLAGLPRNRTIDLMGRADLLTAYAVLQHAYLFVGNDSGLMHLAAAARVPTLGLFGPSSETRYGPWGPHARAVRGPRSYEQIFHAPDFDHLARVCHMLDLTVDKVESEARAMLEREGPSS
jgi:ADP-heptose:LPS heptosyltransferase